MLQLLLIHGCVWGCVERLTAPSVGFLFSAWERMVWVGRVLPWGSLDRFWGLMTSDPHLGGEAVPWQSQECSTPLTSLKVQPCCRRERKNGLDEFSLPPEFWSLHTKGVTGTGAARVWKRYNQDPLMSCQEPHSALPVLTGAGERRGLSYSRGTDSRWEA